MWALLFVRGIAPHLPKNLRYFRVLHARVLRLDLLPPVLGEVKEGGHGALGGRGVLLGPFVRHLPRPRIRRLLPHVPLLVLGGLVLPEGPIFRRKVPPLFGAPLRHLRHGRRGRHVLPVRLGLPFQFGLDLVLHGREEHDVGRLESAGSLGSLSERVAVALLFVLLRGRRGDDCPRRDVVITFVLFLGVGVMCARCGVRIRRGDVVAYAQPGYILLDGRHRNRYGKGLGLRRGTRQSTQRSPLSVGVCLSEL
mmetsp:Transcript_36246/g.108669  ORF Transcript_36246/g.108669 Transcript_36246/m.108669 type:complete len:252 (+) Transcript_36246:494-1249(+)